MISLSVTRALSISLSINSISSSCFITLLNTGNSSNTLLITCDLLMDPVPIKKKIPTGPLQIKVTALATQYYGFLRNQFQCMDRNRMGKFDIIAQQIKIAALKAGQETFILDDVFNAIVRWLFEKTNASRSSCEVVIAFFIQNCEVFSVASK